MKGIRLIVLKVRIFYFTAVMARTAPLPVSPCERAWLIS